jgi:hypothetical protein
MQPTLLALLDDVVPVPEVADGEVLQDALSLLAGQHLDHGHGLDQQQVAEAVPLVEVLGGQHRHQHGAAAVLGHTHRGAALLLCVCV